MTEMTSKRSISLTPGFALFFLYALWVWLCEAADLACYLTGLAQCTLLSRVLVTALLAGGVWLLRKDVAVEKWQRPDGLFLLCSVLFVGAVGFKALLPDMSWDVVNYHLAVQNPGFEDMVDYHYVPGYFQMFGFRWADRLFYFFRVTLGYRMGTLLNALVVLLLCSQMRRLLLAVLGQRLESCRSYLPKGLRWALSPNLLAFLIVLSWDCMNQQATYFVELLGLPFAMEALYLLLTEWNKPQNARQMVWFAFLNGCLFAFKMTQVVYAAPLVLLYLFLHRKDLTVGRFFAAFVVAVIPVSLYLLYNFAETGNPIFPYFNSLFRSPYYGLENFKDTRWGPQNLRDTLLWPFISTFFPYYYGCEVPNQYVIGIRTLMVGVGGMCLGMLFRRKWRSPRSVLLMVFLVVSGYLWTVTTGYIRYFALGEMVVGLVALDCLTRLLEHGGRKRLVAVVPMAILLVQPFHFMHTINGGFEIAWRNNYQPRVIAENLQDAFRDRDVSVDFTEEMPEADMILINNGANGGLATLLFPDTPVVQNFYLHVIQEPGQWNAESRAVTEVWSRRIAEALQDGIVYEPLVPGGCTLEAYVEILNGYDICLETVYWPDNVFASGENIQVLQLTAKEDGCSHGLYYANRPEDSLPAENREVRLQGEVLLDLVRGQSTDRRFRLSVAAQDARQEETLYTLELGQRETVALEAVLDLTGFDDTVTLTFTCTEVDGSPMPEGIDCIVMNPLLS